MAATRNCGGGLGPSSLRVSESLTDCVHCAASPLSQGPFVTVEFSGLFSTKATWLTWKFSVVALQ